MRGPSRTPNFTLPRSDKPFFGGAATSVVLHGVLILLIVIGERTTHELFLAGGGSGPAGGGGGGGAELIRYVDIPAFRTASAAAAEVPEERTVAISIPKPVLREIPQEAPRIAFARPTEHLTAPEVGSGAGSGGGSGSGTGTGGGVGTGQGTGVGSGEGPGSGGDGGSGFAPQSRQMLLPPGAPASIKGTEYRVRFWINELGEVTKVEIEPRIADGKYRKKFMEKMRQFTFHPARSADGTPVAAHYDVLITP